MKVSDLCKSETAAFGHSVSINRFESAFRIRDIPEILIWTRLWNRLSSSSREATCRIEFWSRISVRSSFESIADSWSMACFCSPSVGGFHLTWLSQLFNSIESKSEGGRRDDSADSLLGDRDETNCSWRGTSSSVSRTAIEGKHQD